MDETNWRDAKDKAQGIGEGGMAVSNDGRSVQSVASPEDSSGRSVVGTPKTAFFNMPRRFQAPVPLKNRQPNRKISSRHFTCGSGMPIVAVGTIIADRPPHRSVRAELLHTAPILDVWRRSARLDTGAESEQWESTE